MEVTVVETCAPENTVEVVIVRVIASIVDPFAVVSSSSSGPPGSAMNGGMN